MIGLWRRWLRRCMKRDVSQKHTPDHQTHECLVGTREGHVIEPIHSIEPDPEVDRLQERLDGLMQETSTLTRRVYEEFDRRREVSVERNLLLRRRHTDR